VEPKALQDVLAGPARKRRRPEGGGQGAPAAAVRRLRDEVLARGVPRDALHVVAVVGQAQAALAGVHVPQHADILDRAGQQRARVGRPRQVEHVIAVPAPAREPGAGA
jgi:hypothetical protein